MNEVKQKKRRPLTDYEKQCAARLKSIWLAYKAVHCVNQIWLGEQLGGKSQALAGQYLGGKIPLNLNAIIRFSEILGCSPKDIDPSVPVEDALTERERFILMAYRHHGDKVRALIDAAADLAETQLRH